LNRIRISSGPDLQLVYNHEVSQTSFTCVTTAGIKSIQYVDKQQLHKAISIPKLLEKTQSV